MAAKTIELHGGPAKISRGFFVSGDLNYVKPYQHNREEHCAPDESIRDEMH
nr:MAG TPA: hypothetical protein [Caudoviricetes sp.]